MNSATVLEEGQFPLLPKWVRVFITGTSVTKEQAKDIIFRTDVSVPYISEYGYGNDKQFNAYFNKVCGLSRFIEARNKAEYDPTFDRTEQAWRDELEIITPLYVHNAWLATSYAGGPHGWCSPEGGIHFDGYRWGGWPKVPSIKEDWQMLIEAFPYLDLACTLFDESDPPKPLVTFSVSEGSVLVTPPALGLHEYAPTFEQKDNLSEFRKNIANNTYYHERGWPEGWVEEFGAKSTAAMRKVAPYLPE